MKVMKPKWHRNLVIVCEKCGKKQVAGKDLPNPSHELKDWLKKQFLARDLWGANRVITSSCLDICPDGKVAVAFTSDRPDLETWAEVIDPITERDRILHIATERAKSGAITKNPVRIPEELRAIAPAYLESRKRDLAVLKDALTRKDFDFIAKLSHKTKGTAGGYGFDELTIIAKSLEMAAKSQNSVEAEAAFAAMNRYLNEVEIQT